MIRKVKLKERGQAMVEMALVFLALVLISMMILDFGRALYDYSVVYNSAREGARYGIIPLDYGDPPTIDVTGIINAARNRAAGLDVTVDTPLLLQNPYRIQVKVSMIYVPVTPLISGIVGSSRTIESTAVMHVEK